MANWEYQNYTTCSNCQNVEVYKDTNPNSATYLNYKIGTGGTAQSGQPSGTQCNYDPIYGTETYGCSGCSEIGTRINTNPCSNASNQVRTVSSDSDFCKNSGNCCGPTAKIPNYVWQGDYDCVGCQKYKRLIDINPCTNGEPTLGDAVGSNNNSECGGCCGQSTEPNWVNTGSPYCSRGVQYQLRTNNNPCSSPIPPNATDSVATGNNDDCWQISDIYYMTCANAKSASEPYQSYVLNGLYYKYYTYGTHDLLSNNDWENVGYIMTGDWYFNDSTGSHHRIFNDDGTIRNTDTGECSTGGDGGGELEQLG